MFVLILDQTKRHQYAYKPSEMIERTSESYYIDLKSFNYGVKGPCQLSRCKFYNVYKSTNIDFMHLIGLGVIKSLFEYWFDKKLGPYSLRDNYNEIEKRYLSINPPDYLPATPKHLPTWRNWKANEFINFILFYSIPLFFDLMDKDYFNHLYNFVLALEIILSENILVEHLEKANELLHIFVKKMSSLYEPSILKSGIHELLHLVQCTREIGPLIAFSCFPYEELNRKMIRYIKGHNLMGDEFYKLFAVQKSLCFFSRNHSFSSPAIKEYVEKYSKIRTSNRKGSLIIDFKLTGVINNINCQSLTDFILLQNKTTLNFYKSIVYQGIRYSVHANTKFNNSCIKSGLRFGLICLIFSENSESFCICQQLKVSKENFSHIKAPPLSCFLVNNDKTDTYFICPFSCVEKVFFMGLKPDLSYINFFSSYHFFT